MTDKGFPYKNTVFAFVTAVTGPSPGIAKWVPGRPGIARRFEKKFHSSILFNL